MTAVPSRLLIVKPSSFGDVIHALPVLDALHRAWPQTQIDWIVKPEWAPLLAGHPMLRDVLHFPRTFSEWRRTVADLFDRRYDMAIDLQGLFRSALLCALARISDRVGFANGREGSRWWYTRKVLPPTEAVHAVDRYLAVVQQLGVPIGPSRRFPLPPHHDADEWAERLWRQEQLEGEPVCVIHPAARWVTKRWAPERYAELCDRLIATCACRVLLVASSSQRDQVSAVRERMQAHPVDLAGRTTLSQLAALLRRAAVLVTNDSGPMHLAAAVGTPVVALFGPTDPRKIGPWGEGHAILQADIDCSPCSRQRCVQGLACLNGITVEEVATAVEPYLRRAADRVAPCDETDVASSTAKGGSCGD